MYKLNLVLIRVVKCHESGYALLTYEDGVGRSEPIVGLYICNE